MDREIDWLMYQLILINDNDNDNDNDNNDNNDNDNDNDTRYNIWKEGKKEIFLSLGFTLTAP